MKNNGTTTSAASKHLLDEMNALVAEAEKMMGVQSSEQTDDAVGTLRARFDLAQERLSEIYTDARKKVVDGAKHTDKAIRANPYQSMAIAAGVGMVIGLLVGRRNK